MTRARASPATLHNHLGGRAPGGQGEEGRTAPRWSHCAAVGVRRMLDGWPKRKVRHRLMELAADGAAWSQVATELRDFLSDAHHYNTALDVLRYMRDRLSCMETYCGQEKGLRVLHHDAEQEGQRREASRRGHTAGSGAQAG